MGKDHSWRRFADFRSISDHPRFQPDPVVLREMDRDLLSFATAARGLGADEEFIEMMINHYVQGFQRLDAIPRDHPFWGGTNRRPTPSKIRDYLEKFGLEKQQDLQFLQLRASCQVVNMSFSPDVWKQLSVATQLNPVWIVQAAFMAELIGSYDTVAELIPVLTELELCASVDGFLRALANSEDSYVAEWAKRVAEGCGAVT
jgi:hypothetical protein